MQSLLWLLALVLVVVAAIRLLLSFLSFLVRFLLFLVILLVLIAVVVGGMSRPASGGHNVEHQASLEIELNTIIGKLHHSAMPCLKHRQAAPPQGGTR